MIEFILERNILKFVLMNKIILLIIVLFTVSVSAQRMPKIKGNKSVVEVNNDLPPFHTIKLENDLEIFLEESQIPGYRIVADDNLIDIIRFDVTDSILVIRSFYKITSKKQLDITINYSNLKEILAEAGSVTANENIDSETLHVHLSDGAYGEIKCRSSQMQILMEGSSKGKFNVETDTISIEVRGKSNLTFYGLLGGVNLDMYESAQSLMEGTADSFSLVVNDNSDLRAERLEAAEVYARLEESAKARLNVYREFLLSASGMSKTYLWGNPSIQIEAFLDSAELYKKEE